MLDLSYRRYFIRFNDKYVRDKSSFYAIYKSAKKRIRASIKILSFLREKIRSVLYRTRDIFKIID